MNKKPRYRKFLMLTPEESMRLVELSEQLETSQSETVGRLIEMAKVINPAKTKKQLFEESLHLVRQ